ncbi:heterokaryon incompatibility protein-domain-containing protein [Xylariaceae sp. FL1651]|nr:heterokaryon incompatibility protein-domain-containing protein [Xylariaceae sp. FL1651]
MRLIRTRTLELHEFESSSDGVPPYAILSHTWGDGEITFRDMSIERSKRPTGKKEYAKIIQTCRLALAHDLDYAWVDTCCIDKSSSAELSESINSMFKWYENAAVCYVFLFDYVPGEVELGACRWWTRGWTLQELLAPKNIIFYDAAWNFVGTKVSLIDSISKITGIHSEALSEDHDILARPVAERMSWASSRCTTRVEDIAYCLLGIFDVHIPLLYGEGHMAFRRLQEEIIKRKADLSTFFWNMPLGDSDRQPYINLFAESPSAFNQGLFSRRPVPFMFPEFILTNKGVLFSGILSLYQIRIPGEEGTLPGEKGRKIYGFHLELDDQDFSARILLRKIAPGIFCRVGRFSVNRYSYDSRYPLPNSTSSFYILTDPTPPMIDSMISCRHLTLHVPYDERFCIADAVPEHLWDATDHTFLLIPRIARAYSDMHQRYSMILAMKILAIVPGTSLYLVVLCEDNNNGTWGGCRIFPWDQYTEEANILFSKQNRQQSILASDFRKLMPAIASLKNYCQVKVGQRVLEISVSLLRGTIEVMSKQVEVWKMHVRFYGTLYKGALAAVGH